MCLGREAKHAERTIAFNGAYFAAFDRVSCFMWVALIDARVIATPAWLEIDAAGDLYMLLRMDGDLVLQNPDAMAVGHRRREPSLLGRGRRKAPRESVLSSCL